jgi:EAL domain-containing protein (putative c-di-GMP-specific phosphodiesterase class I)
MEKGLNILYVDLLPEKKSGLLKALRDSDYTVTEADPSTDPSSGREMPGGPGSLVLCRMNGVAAYDALGPFLKGLGGAGTRVMLTSDPEQEFYLRGMEYGFTEFILLPCSDTYLAAKLVEISRRAAPPRDAVPGDISPITLESGSMQARVHLEGIVKSLRSFIENSIHQNALIQGFLRHRPAFRGLSGDVDIIPVADSVFSAADMLREEMSQALERREFEIYYQPVLSLRDDGYCGFEALIRWNHPQKGILLPDQFIASAEESPLIVPLGYWIVEEVARQLARWRGLNLPGPLRVNVNLSARQFVDQDLSRRIIDITAAHGVDPATLGLEITESTFMENMESANLNLLKLKSENFIIYMDDFGTGYSSLSYLLHFPVDIIKIDKSFVQWMHIDEESEEIVRSVIMLAHNLKRQVVAEGVEEQVHLDMLKSFDCDYIQGYLVARPLSAEAAGRFLESRCGR